jgi:hypothetical protein
MQVTLTNTTQIVTLNGVPARIWEGTTSTGIRVHAFITGIAVHNDDNQEQFERELLHVTPPTAEVPVYPAHMVI